MSDNPSPPTPYCASAQVNKTVKKVDPSPDHTILSPEDVAAAQLTLGAAPPG